MPRLESWVESKGLQVCQLPVRYVHAPDIRGTARPLNVPDRSNTTKPTCPPDVPWMSPRCPLFVRSEYDFPRFGQIPGIAVDVPEGPQSSRSSMSESTTEATSRSAVAHAYRLESAVCRCAAETSSKAFRLVISMTEFESVSV